MNNGRSNRSITVTGVVTPSDWDKHNNVVQVAIETDYFQKYIVAEEMVGKELMQLIDASVSVQGVIDGEDFYGNPIIILKKYKVMKKNALDQ